MTLEARANGYYEWGYTAYDALGNDITSLVKVSAPFYANNFSLTIGKYYVNYTVTDQAGNVGNNNRTVWVRDTTRPVLKLLGNTTISLPYGTKYVDPGAYAVDLAYGDITKNIMVRYNTTFASLTVGQAMQVAYLVTDNSGNRSLQGKRIINITKPSGCPDQSVVITALVGVVVFIVAGVLMANIIRSKGIDFLATRDTADPGFVVHSEEFDRVFVHKKP